MHFFLTFKTACVLVLVSLSYSAKLILHSRWGVRLGCVFPSTLRIWSHSLVKLWKTEPELHALLPAWTPPFADPVTPVLGSEYQRHGRGHAGLEGSDLDEAGGLQSLTKRPPRPRVPEAGKLPSSRRVSEGEQVRRDVRLQP